MISLLSKSSSAQTHPSRMLAAAQGDDEALAALVRAYHDRVYRFGLRVCRDGFDADDAVQEAFSKLVKRPDVVHAAGNDRGILLWLMRVVKNACIRMLRPFVRDRLSLGERIDADEVSAPDASDPLQALERWRLVQAVHAAIAALDRASREVLVMRDLEGLSGDETCAALGLELSTMKTRLHRARTRLRLELEENSPRHQRKQGT